MMRKLSYFGNMIRSKDSIGKELMLGRTKGTRRRGRTHAELKNMALDRMIWRRVTH